MRRKERRSRRQRQAFEIHRLVQGGAGRAVRLGDDVAEDIPDKMRGAVVGTGVLIKMCQ
jgi:hypothetical protein